MLTDLVKGDMFEGEPIHEVVEFVRIGANGEYGHLLLMRDRLVYLGERRIDLPLAQVYHVHAGYDDDGETLSVQLAGTQRATKFWFDTGRERVAEMLMYLVRAAQAEET